MNRQTTIEQQLKAGKAVAVYTKGSSMRPLLKEGKTYVIVQPIADDLTVGQLPLFAVSKGVYMIHRIIGVEDNAYYTRGDNCISTEKVPKKKVLGVVTEICRGKKTVAVTDRSYRIYVKLWQAIAPLRILLYRLRATI